MPTLRKELKKKVRRSKLGKLADGDYHLQDGTILTKAGEKYVLTRKRNPEKVKALSKYSEKRLRKILLKPVEYNYKLEDLEGLSKEDLVKLVYPRPQVVFCHIWLRTSSNLEAKTIRKLIRKAKRIPHEQYREKAN